MRFYKKKQKTNQLINMILESNYWINGNKLKKIKNTFWTI